MGTVQNVLIQHHGPLRVQSRAVHQLEIQGLEGSRKKKEVRDYISTTWQQKHQETREYTKADFKLRP
jgi:hypothetical protein